jgi:hypothetical protein
LFPSEKVITDISRESIKEIQGFFLHANLDMNKSLKEEETLLQDGTIETSDVESL